MLAIICLTLVATGPSKADTPPSTNQQGYLQVQVSGPEALTWAGQFLEQGKILEAKKILRTLATADASQINQIDYTLLSAIVLAHEMQFEKAVTILRRLLNHDPTLVRARLELARALFALRHDRAAAYHFQLALAENLPETTKKTIRKYLHALQSRKSWQFRFAAGIVPNSNINTATSDDMLVIQDGRAFQLDALAQENAGVGFSTSLNAKKWFRVTQRWRMAVGGGLHANDYSNTHFDDAAYTLTAGPQYRGIKRQVSAIATLQERWFGKTQLSRTVGGQLRLTSSLAARNRFSVTGRVAYATYFPGRHQQPDGHKVKDKRDGYIHTVGGAFWRTIKKGQTLGVSAQWRRHDTRAAHERNNQIDVAPFYARELPFSVNIRVSPGVIYRKYDAPGSFLPEQRRRDLSVGGSVDVTPKAVILNGFAPIITYSYWKNESNVSLYTYDQHKVNMRLTRMF